MPWRFFLAVVVVSAACSKPQDPAQRREGLQDMKESARELTRAIEENIDSADGTVDTDALARHQQNMNAAADKVGGKMGEAMKAANQLNAEVNTMAAEMNGLVELIPDLIDWQTLHDEEDYAPRRELIANALALNEKMLAFYDEYPVKLAAKLDEVGFQGQERVGFEQGAVKAVLRIQPLVKEVRGADIAMMGIFTNLLDVFEKEKGRWKIEDGEVVFEDEAHQKTYQDSVERIQVLADQQAKAQQKTIEVLKE